MVAYKKEKLENAICFFTEAQQKITGLPVYQTYIYKLLALFDFRHLKEKGKPALDLDYIALEQGPVPGILYNNRDSLETDTFEIVPDENGNYYFKLKEKCNLDFFSLTEIKILEELKNEFIRKGMDTQELINAAHNEIKAWEKAWERRGDKKRVEMSYIDEYENVMDKDEESITPEEESFLIYYALKRMKNASCWNLD